MILACCTNAIGLLVIAVTVFLVRRDQVIENRKSRLLLSALVVTGVIIILKMMSVFLAGDGSWWAKALYPVISAFGFALTPSVSFIVSLVCTDKIKQNHSLLAIPVIVYAIACICSIWTGWIFRISAENTYHRGSIFPMVYVMSIYTFLILLAANHYSVKDYDNSSKMHVVVMYSLVLFAVVMQMFFRPMMLTWCCVTIALMLYYAFLKDKALRCNPLTGVRNQSSFRMRLSELEKAEDIGFVFVQPDQYDQLLEIYGSVRLEKYLIQVAKMVKEAFDLIGKTYQINPTKLCVLIENADEIKIEETLNYLKKMLDNFNSREKVDIHVLVVFNIMESGESVFESYRRGTDNCEYSSRKY